LAAPLASIALHLTKIAFFCPLSPTHLLVHIKRFETSDGEEGRISKDSYPVSIPEKLNLRNCSVSAICTSPVYRLQSFLLHRGDSIDEGHYVSFGSRPRNDGSGDGWVEFDDEATSVVALDRTLSLKEVQENAYLVLYSTDKKRAVSDDDRSAASSLAPLDSASGRRQRPRASVAAEPAGEVPSGGAMSAAAAAAAAAAAPQGAPRAAASPGWSPAVDRVVDRVVRRLYNSTYSDGGGRLSDEQVRDRQRAMRLHASNPDAVRGFARAYLRGAAAGGEPLDADACGDEWVEKCAGELVNYAKYRDPE
jgi:hypothetical protein